MEKCALCLQSKPLCDSHIIPEFCFKPTHDLIHRAILMKSDELKQCFIQKGIRVKMLCVDCEQLINQHEKYFKSFWFDKKALPDHVPSRTIEIRGIDYAHFKLFHLSVLWRAHAAKAKPFDVVSLGPYGEKLRQSILACDPGSEGSYPFFGQIIVNDDKSVCYSLVSGAYKSRLDNFTVYYMCYAGCEWTFIVTDHDYKNYTKWTIRKNQHLTLITHPFKELNTIRVFHEQRPRE